MEELRQMLQEAQERLARALKANDLLDVFREYVELARRALFAEWKEGTDWDRIRAELAALDRLERLIVNEANNIPYHRETLDEISAELQNKTKGGL